MNAERRPEGSWRRIGERVVRHRLAHFVVIGAALYALVPAEAGEADVVVTEEQVATLFGAEARKRSDPLAAEDKRRALDAFVEQELLVREAVRVGLERDDPGLRERLAQALVATVVRGAAGEPVSDAELRAYHAAHKDRWSRPAEARFEYVFVPRSPGARADEALAAATQTKGALERGEGRDMQVREAGPLAPAEVARILGQPMADAVSSAETGRWSGPVASSYGFYLLRVKDRSEAGDASFEAVRAEVDRAVREARGSAARRAFVEQLARRYRVAVRMPADSGLPTEYRFQSPDDAPRTAESGVP